MLESSYLHRQAADIRAAHGIEPQWEVLHGDPADAICRYLKGMPDTLLAMTTHALNGIERAVLGSVAGYCVRHAGVPLLTNATRRFPRNLSAGTPRIIPPARAFRDASEISLLWQFHLPTR